MSLITPTTSHSWSTQVQTAVNGSSIPTFGRKSLTLNLGLRRAFKWIFVVADVHKPILGADFLHHFNIMVDLKKKRLVDTHTQLYVQGILSPSPSPAPSLPTPSATTDDYTKLLSQFPELTQVHNYNDSPVRHDVTHKFTTTGHQPKLDDWLLNASR